MFSITIISVFILITIYHPYHQGMIQFEAWLSASNRKLAVFMFVIVSFPIILLFN